MKKNYTIKNVRLRILGGLVGDVDCVIGPHQVFLLPFPGSAVTMDIESTIHEHDLRGTSRGRGWPLGGHIKKRKLRLGMVQVVTIQERPTLSPTREGTHDSWPAPMTRDDHPPI